MSILTQSDVGNDGGDKEQQQRLAMKRKTSLQELFSRATLGKDRPSLTIRDAGGG